MVFWQIVLVLSALAALFVVWPLLKLPFGRKALLREASRDQTQMELYAEHLADLEKAKALGDIDEAQFQELKLEMQRTLVSEGQGSDVPRIYTGGKRLIVGLGVSVPIIAILLYNLWGAKQDWAIYQFMEDLPSAESQQEYQSRLRQLATMVQARANKRPENLQMHNLLAQTSMALQDYDLAVEAYKNILKEFPESPRIVSNLAQAMFYRAGNTVTPEVREYTQKALQMAPMLPEMLGLAGIDAKNQGDYREAIRNWKLAVSQMDPNSAAAQGYLNGIAKAEEALERSGQSVDVASVEPPEVEVDVDAEHISVSVSLADGVQVSPTDAVFVFARAWEGSPMPLAIRRLTAADLPAQVVLDESMAMAPGMDITSSPKLEVVARVSATGNATPQSGDWQVTYGPVSLDDLQGTINLVLSEQIP